MGRHVIEDPDIGTNYDRKSVAIDIDTWRDLLQFSKDHKITLRTATEITLRTGLKDLENLPPIYETIATSISNTLKEKL